MPLRPSSPTVIRRVVAPVAGLVLTDDLPALDTVARDDAVAFVERRIQGLPSVMHLGVMLVAAIYRSLLAVPGGTTIVRRLARTPLPVLGEYPRLIRSLAYTHIWESVPDRRADGASA
jgi:hypothetical protein